MKYKIIKVQNSNVAQFMKKIAKVKGTIVAMKTKRDGFVFAVSF